MKGKDTTTYVPTRPCLFTLRSENEMVDPSYTAIKSEYVTFRNVMERCSHKSKGMAKDIVAEISEILVNMEFDMRLENRYPEYEEVFADL